MLIQRIATAIVSLTAALLPAQTTWLPPVTVATNAGTSATILLNPQLAAVADGKLSAVWTGHWGANVTTYSITYTSVRHSDVYAAHSADRGNTWATPHQISDSRVLSTFARIIGTEIGDFYYSFTSGDPFTGFRFHIVHTEDDGASYTSNTLLQNLLDLNEGFFQPQIVKAGASLVTGWRGTRSPGISDPLLARSGDNGFSWSYTQVPDPPHTLYSHQVYTAPTMAADGQDVVAPYIMTWLTDYSFPPKEENEVFLMTTQDGGVTWKTHNDATSSTINSWFPYVAAAGDGNWLLFWLGYPGNNTQGSQLYLQKSTTGWDEWSTPTLVAAAPLDVKSAATDGDGRWLVLLRSNALGEINYVWSDDDGETWSGIITIPGTKSSYESDSCAYIGNGQWGVVWADGASIKLTKMEWGESAVSDWVLY